MWYYILIRNIGHKTGESIWISFFSDKTVIKKRYPDTSQTCALAKPQKVIGLFCKRHHKLSAPTISVLSWNLNLTMRSGSSFPYRSPPLALYNSWYCHIHARRNLHHYWTQKWCEVHRVDQQHLRGMHSWKY